MNGKALIRWLWDLGHFRNPEMPTDVIEDELGSLTLTSPQVKTAIRSYQSFMREDFDRLSIAEHGRIGVADGEVGPATAQLFSVDRCACPDFPEGTEPAMGRGSWPAGCTAEYPENHTFGIYWDYGRMPSYLNEVIEECKRLCYASYRDIGIVFFDTELQHANTTVTWERGRGWIGLATVGQNQRCGSQIWAKFDTRYRPSRLTDQWARLLAHEFGHNMGLRHSRGGVMNPSISQGAYTEDEWRGDPSESILRRWFGGEPVPPKDGDEPDPPDPDNPKGPKVSVTGVITFTVDDSEYEFVAKPKI